jgi:hypothetical protein
VECRHPAGPPVPPAQPRTHDADLSGSDRVEVLLDLDRDYQTYFRLVVDRRGCYAEDCWGDRTWNPRWFIAVKDEANGWTAELAIPLLEFSAEPVPPGRLWAANVLRVLPGRGVLAWSTPADAAPRPEGLGVLLFIQEQKPKARAAMPEK